MTAYNRRTGECYNSRRGTSQHEPEFCVVCGDALPLLRVEPTDRCPHHVPGSFWWMKARGEL
eukprot:1815858-Prymnesium_polylepis.2